MTDPITELLHAAQPALAALDLAPVERHGTHAILVARPPGKAPMARLSTIDDLIATMPALSVDIERYRGDGTRVAIVVVVPGEYQVCALEVPLRVVH